MPSSNSHSASMAATTKLQQLTPSSNSVVLLVWGLESIIIIIKQDDQKRRFSQSIVWSRWITYHSYTATIVLHSKVVVLVLWLEDTRDTWGFGSKPDSNKGVLPNPTIFVQKLFSDILEDPTPTSTWGNFLLDPSHLTQTFRGNNHYLKLKYIFKNLDPKWTWEKRQSPKSILRVSIPTYRCKSTGLS